MLTGWMLADPNFEKDEEKSEAFKGELEQWCICNVRRFQACIIKLSFVRLDSWAYFHIFLYRGNIDLLNNSFLRNKGDLYFGKSRMKSEIFHIVTFTCKIRAN